MFLISSCTLEGVNYGPNEEKVYGQKDTMSENKDQLDFDLEVIANENDSTYQPDDRSKKMTTETGVEVTILKKGRGRFIKQEDVLIMHYTANRMSDKKRFDHSLKFPNGLGVKLGIGIIVKGLEEGLLQLRSGDRASILVPATLAYGEKGYGPLVPPNCDVKYTVKIEKVVDPILTEKGLKIYKTYEMSGDVPDSTQDITIGYMAFEKGKSAPPFASSMKNGPFTFKFKAKNTLPWQNDAFDYIRPGEEVFIEVPSEMAYGSKGLKNIVSPDSDLIYKLSIIDIK